MVIAGASCLALSIIRWWISVNFGIAVAVPYVWLVKSALLNPRWQPPFQHSWRPRSKLLALDFFVAALFVRSLTISGLVASKLAWHAAPDARRGIVRNVAYDIVWPFPASHKITQN